MTTFKFDPKTKAAEIFQRAVARIKLVPFADIKLGKQQRYRLKGVIPSVGVTVVWGPPKCGKSFTIFDMVIHVALGWEYRGRRVKQCPVVYCAFEGQTGIEARVEAFRQKNLDCQDIELPPFYLQPVTLNLVRDHPALITATQDAMPANVPGIVVLDTLNRSFAGSESSDEDMTAYIQAADAIREAFDCAVIIIHHCGVDGTRPRGHTSLTGAVEAQLSVKRDTGGTIIMEVEYMKDGAQGDRIASRLEPVTVGTDEDGEDITSCIVVPVDVPTKTASGDSLSKNQQTMFSLLYEARRPLTMAQWNEKAREAGLGL